MMTPLADLLATQPAWAWAALAAALLAVELLTGSGWLLWPAASAAAVAGLVAALALPMAPAVLVFAALTIVSTAAARRYAPRTHGAGRRDINDNVGRVVGHRGRVVAAFEAGAGRVFVDGKEWAAELRGPESPPLGGEVEVLAVSGARLTVRSVSRPRDAA